MYITREKFSTAVKIFRKDEVCKTLGAAINIIDKKERKIKERKKGKKKERKKKEKKKKRKRKDKEKEKR